MPGPLNYFPGELTTTRTKGRFFAKASILSSCLHPIFQITVSMAMIVQNAGVTILETIRMKLPSGMSAMMRMIRRDQNRTSLRLTMEMYGNQSIAMILDNCQTISRSLSVAYRELNFLQDLVISLSNAS